MLQNSAELAVSVVNVSSAFFHSDTFTAIQQDGAGLQLVDYDGAPTPQAAQNLVFLLYFQPNREVRARHAAPKLDLATTLAALTPLGKGVLVLRGRRANRLQR